jgi:hypothetical protein
VRPLDAFYRFKAIHWARKGDGGFVADVINRICQEVVHLGYSVLVGNQSATARAKRGAAQQDLDREHAQLVAESNKWAPGSDAVLSLAQDFRTSDAAQRLATPISPARLPAQRRCPAGHVLSREPAAGSQLGCDRPGCGAKIAAGAAHYACAECDYDVCARCAY